MPGEAIPARHPETVYDDPRRVHRLRRLRPKPCPVDAIRPEDMVPANWQHYIERNAAYYRGGQPCR
jgi:hypothetical protein